MTFTYDENDLLPVEQTDEFQYNGKTGTIYKVGDWSFELPGDESIGQAKEAALAWIAWHEFLVSQQG